MWPDLKGTLRHHKTTTTEHFWLVLIFWFFLVFLCFFWCFCVFFWCFCVFSGVFWFFLVFLCFWWWWCVIDCSKKPGKVFGGGCLVVAERALYNWQVYGTLAQLMVSLVCSVGTQTYDNI